MKKKRDTNEDKEKKKNGIKNTQKTQKYRTVKTKNGKTKTKQKQTKLNDKVKDRERTTKNGEKKNAPQRPNTLNNATKSHKSHPPNLNLHLALNEKKNSKPSDRTQPPPYHPQTRPKANKQKRR